MDGSKVDLKGLSLAEIEQLVADLGQPRYRADQIASWVFEKGASDFGEMTNLPASLREELHAVAEICRSKVAGRERSTDGTRKFLLEYTDGARIEVVSLVDEGRTTGCISTQVGCRFGCSFCATGYMGFLRDLTAGEVVEEILALRRLVEPERLGNLVLMGMGEPMDNYDAVLAAVRIANAPWGLGIGARRITVSTAGHVPGIRRLAKEGLQVNLAVSLNAPEQGLRESIMPIAGDYPLDELLSALGEYAEATGRMITLEYVLLKGLNDSDEMADRLAVLASRFPCKINLICYNEVADSSYGPPNDSTVEHFLARLRKRCPTVVRRLSRGSDISAGCGQLCVPWDRVG
jgi:23S rRNA (adenine2503-C2)-methyltransferase